MTVVWQAFVWWIWFTAVLVTAVFIAWVWHYGKQRIEAAVWDRRNNGWWERIRDAAPDIRNRP